MFVEQRRYSLQPGRAADYLKLYETIGMVVQARHLPVMLGYYSTEVGGLNTVVHLWGHESLDAREENRSRMRADPEFQAYWAQVRPLVIAQTSEILRPAPFFEERLHAMARTAIAGG